MYQEIVIFSFLLLFIIFMVNLAQKSIRKQQEGLDRHKEAMRQQEELVDKSLKLSEEASRLQAEGLEIGKRDLENQAIIIELLREIKSQMPKID